MSLDTNNNLLNSNNELIERIKTKASQISGGGASEQDDGVKLFASVDEMNTSTGNEKGDLAVVYGVEIQNTMADSIFQTAKFPKTVVLPTAITDEFIQISYSAAEEGQWLDCWGELTATGFDLECYTENGQIGIYYNSSDGKTYNRIDDEAEIVDFGMPIKYRYPDEWNDAIGYFVLSESVNFGGLFEYISYLDETKIILPLLSDTTYDTGKPVTHIRQDGTQYDVEKIITLIQKIITDKSLDIGSYPSGNIFRANGKLCFGYRTFIKNNALVTGVMSASYMYDANGHIDKLYSDLYQPSGTTVNSSTYYYYALDLDNMTYEEQPSVAGIIEKSHISDYMNGYYEVPNIETFILTWNLNNNMYGVSTNAYKFFTDTDGVVKHNLYRSSLEGSLHPDVYEYIFAKTQLDATADSVYAKMFYGQNGVETGTLQNIEGLDTNQVLGKVDLVSSISSIPYTDCEALFEYRQDIKAGLNTSILDTTGATTMRRMFYSCNFATDINVSSLNTSNVVSMEQMFGDCSKVSKLILCNFDTGKVETMKSMFISCKAATHINVSSFNTSAVQNMSSMFQSCSVLTELNLSNFDTSLVTDMSFMFAYCKALMKLDISSFDFTNVTSKGSMFLDVPANCEILVKNQTAKDFILGTRSDLTNVKVTG